MVFFKKEDEEGVALTSTSASHIANLAKEYIQGVEAQLNNISFFNVEVALVGSTGGTSTIQTKDKIYHPHKVDGKGRDALIYTYSMNFKRSTGKYRLN